MIKISRKEYVSLLQDSLKLSMLEAGGVDNWQQYHDSLYPDGEKGYDELCEDIEEGTPELP